MLRSRYQQNGWLGIVRKSEARERVLQAAESLFMRRGYEAVTVKDIAKEAGIHHASIYHHVPGGKADLFVEVMTRHLRQHQAGIQAAIGGAGDDLEAQLRGISAWLLSQPPMDLIRLTNSDLPSIDPKSAEELENLAFFALLVPIQSVLEQAQQRGEIDHPNLGIVAGAILSSVEGLHMISEEYVQGSRQQMAEQLIEVFIRGIARV
ncbi:MAG: TetR/AcrR family transcriptional regulator [Microcoleaceae cyanobacterium]